MSSVACVDNPEQSQFEARLEGQLVGLAAYRLTVDVIAFIHTEVAPEFEGRGVGSQLAKYALDQVRSDGDLKVLPACPFIKWYIQEKPEYGDLLV